MQDPCGPSPRKVGSRRAVKPPHSRGSQTWPVVSWERAQKEARRWVDGLNLPTRSMQGQSVDLSAQARKLAFEPRFKVMVIRAATRAAVKSKNLLRRTERGQVLEAVGSGGSSRLAVEGGTREGDHDARQHLVEAQHGLAVLRA